MRPSARFSRDSKKKLPKFGNILEYFLKSRIFFGKFTEFSPKIGDHQGGFMIVKKVTLIKIFWTQTIKNLKKICMESEKVCHESCKNQRKFYGFQFLFCFWSIIGTHLNSEITSVSKISHKRTLKTWIIFDILHVMAHFLTFNTNFFQNFYFLGPENFDQSYLFYDHETPLIKPENFDE